MERVTCLGWADKSNIGDDNYPITFPLVFPNYNLKFTDKIENINETDAIFLGGGNVVNSYFVNQLKNINIPKYIFSAGVIASDPINELNQFKEIYVRDVKSLELLKKNNIQCHFLPDFAFLLKGDVGEGNKMLKSFFHNRKADLYKKKVAVVINSYLLPSNNTSAHDFLVFNQFCSHLSRIIDNTNASFIFVPFCTSFPDDRISNGIVYAKCKFWNKNIMIYNPLSVQDSLNIFSCVDFVISSRLHSSIFSCICSKPFIDITHHDKNRGFLETIDKIDWSVDYWKFDVVKLEFLLQSFMKDSTKYEVELSNFVDKNRHDIQVFSKKFSSLQL